MTQRKTLRHYGLHIRDNDASPLQFVSEINQLLRPIKLLFPRVLKSYSFSAFGRLPFAN